MADSDELSALRPHLYNIEHEGNVRQIMLE